MAPEAVNLRGVDAITTFDQCDDLPITLVRVRRYRIFYVKIKLFEILKVGTNTVSTSTVLVRFGVSLRVDLNPLPVLFSEKDFKYNFRLSGNFVPVGQFFPGQTLNFLQIGSRKWVWG